MASSLQLDLSSEEVLALVEAGVISGQTIHDAYRAEAASAGWPRSDLPEIDVLESLVAKGVLTNEGVLDWMQSGVVTAQTGPAGGRSSKPRRRPTDPKDKAPWYMRGLNAPIFVKTDLQPELALLSRQGNCVAHGIGHVIGKALDAVAYAKIFPAAASRGRKYVDVAAALGVGLQEAPGRACVVGASESGQDTMAAEISEGAPRDAAMVAALAKRVRIAGAATSRETFKSMWSDVTEKSSKLANSSAADPPQFHGVVAATERLADIVNKNHEEWNDDVKRLGMAALMLYRSRQSDVSLLQHGQLLWVLLGGRELRAHSDRAYFYDHSLGHFEGFDGLMPPTVLAAAGNAMLTLEGLFRSFKAPVARKDADVLNAIDSSIKEALAQNNNDLPSAMLTFHDNCMFNKGNNLLKAGSAAPGRQSEPGGDGEDAEGALAAPAPDTSNSADSWFVLAAQTISKVPTKLQYELLGNKLVPYCIEWCSTDMQRVPGCACADCCVLYDRSAFENVCLLSSRSPENNIYLGIPTPLLDPVLDAAMERVQRVYEQTFWSIPESFVFGQAAQALAKRGQNIDQITVYWGPGGVGLSLYTSHLHAMHGDKNHKFFDPNIFFQDEEMRKVVELLVGGCIFTGQERPPGQRSSMRQDLLKKFATADTIAGRLPYSILTKMYRIIGWKRMEVNQFFTFDNVNEHNLESIVRRIAIIKIQSRFFDKLYVDKIILTDPSRYGIFARDPDAEDFMISGAAVAAGHKIQYAFEVENGPEACRDILVNYTKCGGDHGVTEKYVRIACHIKAANAAESAASAVAEGLVDPPSQDGHLPSSPIVLLSNHLVKELQRKGLNYLTYSVFRASATPPGARLKGNKEEQWESLKGSDLWIDVGSKGKAEDRLIPRVKTQRDASILCSRRPPCCDAIYPEHCDASALEAARCTSRLANEKTLAGAFNALASAIAPARGRPAKGVLERIESLDERAQKILSMTETPQRLLDRSKRSADLEVKRRKLASKQPSVEKSPTRHTGRKETVPLDSFKSYRRAVEWPSRQYVNEELSAQAMDQRLQHIIEKLGIIDAQLFADEIAALQRVRADREGVCRLDEEAWASFPLAPDRDVFKMLPFKGKQVLIKLICGGALPKELSENELAKMLVRTARFLRWLAVGLYPEQFKLLESAQDKWSEASLASYMWQGVEDYCLEQWVDFVMEEKVSHVSLHFDGLRVDKGRVLLSQAGGDARATAVSDAEKVKSFCKKSEERILATTGYSVSIRNKERYYFIDLLRASAFDVEPADAPSDVEALFSAGNGIFCAMAALAGNWSDMSTKAAAAATPPSAAAASAASSPLFWAPPRRSYRTCARAANVKLLPVEVPQESCPGLFLVHCEPDVAPLCVGIDVKQRGPHKCYVGRERWSLPAGALDEAVLAALDRCMVVAFQMKPADRDGEDHRDSSLDGALDLFAGAGIEDNVAALGCSIRGIVPFDRRRLTWRGNCIPFGIAALTGDWDGAIAAATVDSDESAAAMASGLRRYSDCANLFGVSLRPVPTTALQAENIAQLSKYSSTAAASYTQKGYLGTYLEVCLDACLRIILDFGVEAAFALGGGHSSTLGDDVAARDAMDMVAGAGVEEEGAVDVANADDEHAEELDDDSCVRVHANLLQLLRDEVTDFEMIVKSLSRTGATKDGNGSHQPKNLLQRSADLMRRSVSPPLRCLGVDKQIRLLLDHDGPRFVNFEEFAELVFRESILHEGRVRPMRARIVTRFKEAGSCVTHLLPGKVVQWLSLMEDVFSSPFVEELRTNLMGELVDNTEFEHVSLDATLRTAMRVKGQANYREPAEIRAAAPFPDGVAKRRILTAKGRTSAAIGMWPVASEAASVVKAALRNHLPERALQQCVSVASDDPSATLFAELKQIMPQLKFLCLDPVHLAIVYNQAHWREHSPGQAVLRIILNKFNKVSSDLNGAAWGAPYTGHQASSLSAAEGRAQSLIAGGGMQKRRAHKIIADLDANEPFVRKLEFIEALAALTSVYWEEVDRRTPAAPSKKLADVIANAAQHSRCEYLFNNLRMRHSLPARALPLLGSGTSPNEALRSEINRWFNNQPELYAQTLELQLGVNIIGKQMMHNSAMYAPTLRQLSSQTVAASVVCSFAISAAEWANHCASQAREQRALRKAQLPLALQRKAAEPLANKWKVDHKRMVVARKPAGQQQFIRTLKRPGAAKQRKRTPFSLVRKRS
ncbi:unnamed protein product [Prorocentrum cordatum]|uniref:Calmodulin n=1 Tax=Prorocentrum cordatum TaxID=2364126 RepID=A0ABN9XZ84_9DINO|nr:unnamed protein product [Polarella glacialis]